jgi:hypothetical protein
MNPCCGELVTVEPQHPGIHTSRGIMLSWMYSFAILYIYYDQPRSTAIQTFLLCSARLQLCFVLEIVADCGSHCSFSFTDVTNKPVS